MTASVENRAGEILMVGGVGLFLVSLSLLFAVGRSISYLSGPYLSGLTLLAVVLGMLQSSSALGERLKVSGALAYIVGVLLVGSSHSWIDWLVWQRLESMPTQQAVEADLLLRFLKIDIVFPGLLLIPAFLTFIGVAKGVRKYKTVGHRVYVLGGMLAALYILCRLWYAAFAKWYFTASGGIAALSADLVSYPTFLLLAVAGILLGCLPQSFHARGKVGTGLAIGYVLGIVLFSVGVRYAVWPRNPAVLIVGGLGLCLVSAPYILAVLRLMLGKARVV